MIQRYWVILFIFKKMQKLIAGMDREISLDPMALDFAGEVARRAIVRSQSSVN